MQSDLWVRLAGAVAVVGVGYASKRVGLVQQGDASAVLRLILNVTLPAILLNSFATARLSWSAVAPLAAVAAAHAAALTAGGLLLFRRRTPEVRSDPNR